MRVLDIRQQISGHRTGRRRPGAAAVAGARPAASTTALALPATASAAEPAVPAVAAVPAVPAVIPATHAAAAAKPGQHVIAWGGNSVGQLGDGSTTPRDAPGFVELPAHTKVASIAAGYQTGYAGTSTGRLLAWGFNADGQLGDGSLSNHMKPHQVHLPGGVRIAAATAGQLHALAATTTGRVLAWGFNAYGQLGNGSTSNQRTPVFVRLPAGTKVRALAAGQHFSMAMTAGGQILAWGRDNVGQLGIGSHANRDKPIRVHLPKGFTPTAIGAGWNAEAALAIGHESIRA
jgi:alpha-tubulin suppressor-like RCC1 family protein